MQAKTFFALIESGAKDRSEEKLAFLYDLIDIAMVPALTKEGITAVRSFFYGRLKGVTSEPLTKVNAVKLSGAEAAQAIINAIKTKKRVSRE